MNTTHRLTWLLALVLVIATADARSPVKTDENLVFFPTYASLDPGGKLVTVRIHGWIFEPETDSLSRAALLTSLREACSLEKGHAGAALFEARARAFLVDNERGKTISIRLGDNVYEAGTSGANGHFSTELHLEADEARKLLKTGDAQGWLKYTAVLPERDNRVFAGAVQWIEPEGLSVISDIDDTIKISQVRDKRALMENTFLREYRDVPGAAETYQRWARQGARVHYVSAGPWQLYEPLSQFLAKSGFPDGSLSMKLFRFKDSTFFDLFAAPEATKFAAIEPLLAAFPERRFLLVGDSGERDPEIYGTLARKYPKQITRILIRNASDERPDADRFQQAFRELPAGKWQVFDTFDQVKD